jgi:protocatechuate 4,5-dioxygenase, beta chain
MAKLVGIYGLTHNPYLPRLIQAPDAEEAVRKGAEDYEGLRHRLAALRPDVLLVVASDHLSQWFMDNMPAFCIGKGTVAEGPVPHEKRVFGLAPYRAAVDDELATDLLRQGYRHGVDFAFSQEFVIDHAFTVPLGYLRPEQDLPIVPLWTNVMAPPLPPAERFYTVGQTIREIVEALPSSQRVGVVSSGHLSVEIGGIKTSDAAADAEFDQRMMDLIAAGEAQTVVREATYERLMRAGNVTPGFLNYVLLMGLAGGQKPAATGLRFNNVTASIHYMAWEWHNGAA